MLFLLRGPFKKDGRDYVVVQDGKKKRTMTYARYLLQKDTGERLPPWIEVHHKDEDKENNDLDNLEKKKDYKHKQMHKPGGTNG